MVSVVVGCGRANGEPLRGASFGRRSAEQQEEHPGAWAGVLLLLVRPDPLAGSVEFGLFVVGGGEVAGEFDVPAGVDTAPIH